MKINPLKLSIVVLPLLAVVVIIFLSVNTLRSSRPLSHSNASDTAPDAIDTLSVKQHWQWKGAHSDEHPISHKNSSNPKNSRINSLPFTQASVYQALQEIKISKTGDIALDHTTLLSLDEALERIQNQLNPHSMSILKQLIIESLPGKAGEQTAQLVDNYHQFLKAKQDFSNMYESVVASEGAPTVESLEHHQQMYQELQTLREVYLGQETTGQLFKVTDANADFMFDNMRLDLDNQLSVDEKKVQRQKIHQTFVEQSITLNNWPQRYRHFLQGKDAIAKKQQSPIQQQKDVEALFNQMFTSEEQQKIEHLGLNTL